MSGCPDSLIAVGRDCGCGHPLIWMRGQQRCAVYGTHPAPDAIVYFRNLNAPGAELVDLCMATRVDMRQTLAARRRRLQVVA